MRSVNACAKGRMALSSALALIAGALSMPASVDHASSTPSFGRHRHLRETDASDALVALHTNGVFNSCREVAAASLCSHRAAIRSCSQSCADKINEEHDKPLMRSLGSCTKTFRQACGTEASKDGGAGGEIYHGCCAPGLVCAGGATQGWVCVYHPSPPPSPPLPPPPPPLPPPFPSVVAIKYAERLWTKVDKIPVEAGRCDPNQPFYAPGEEHKVICPQGTTLTPTPSTRLPIVAATGKYDFDAAAVNIDGSVACVSPEDGTVCGVRLVMLESTRCNLLN